MANFARYTTAVVRRLATSLPAEAQRQDPNAPIVEWEKALKQHENYVDILRNKIGLKVIELPADDSQPDCVFVEDVVVAVGNDALITTPGHVSRESETAPMQSCLKELGMNMTVMKDEDPTARMDGGDVLFTGSEFFVGISKRTNEAGCNLLAKTFSSFPVTPIPVEGALHLKSGCSMAGSEVMLQAVGNEQFKKMAKRVRDSASKQYKYLEVGGVGNGSNCLYIDSASRGTTVIHQSFDKYPDTRKVYESLRDTHLISCDGSELAKVDGALTCSSVLLTV